MFLCKPVLINKWRLRQVTLTHAGGNPASGQSSVNIPNRWTLCP